jgi:hypothetical protein
MKVFISWSGMRSRLIAEALRSWLPRVLQSVRPWMSNEDISAGSRWLSEVSNELSEARVGIICVTPENQANPWLLFEAGALSKTLDQTYVCPILLGLSPSQLSGPLSQFQANQLDHNGIDKILGTLNKALGENHLPSEDLTEIVAVWWPKLEARIQELPPAPEGAPAKRPLEDILDEIVANTREQIRRENLRLETLSQAEPRMAAMLDLMAGTVPGPQQAQDRSRMISDTSGNALEAGNAARLVRDRPNAAECQQRAIASARELLTSTSLMTENLLKGPQGDNSGGDKA